MAMHMQTEGDKSGFSSAKFETFANLVESKPHIIINFLFKANRQKLEKHHVNGFETHITCKTSHVHVYPQHHVCDESNGYSQYMFKW